MILNAVKIMRKVDFNLFSLSVFDFLRRFKTLKLNLFLDADSSSRG